MFHFTVKCQISFQSAYSVAQFGVEEGELQWLPASPTLDVISLFNFSLSSGSIHSGISLCFDCHFYDNDVEYIFMYFVCFHMLVLIIFRWVLGLYAINFHI